MVLFSFVAVFHIVDGLMIFVLMINNLYVLSTGMVQPQPDGPMQWDISGEESGGALRVPPELAANEVVTRLLGDNQLLRGRMHFLT